MIIREPLSPGPSGYYKGLPEFYALAQQDELEAKHGCALEFMYVEMFAGGKPEVSVWRKK